MGFSGRNWSQVDKGLKSPQNVPSGYGQIQHSTTAAVSQNARHKTDREQKVQLRIETVVRDYLLEQADIPFSEG